MPLCLGDSGEFLGVGLTGQSPTPKRSARPRGPSTNRNGFGEGSSHRAAAGRGEGSAGRKRSRATSSSGHRRGRAARALSSGQRDDLAVVIAAEAGPANLAKGGWRFECGGGHGATGRDLRLILIGRT